MRGGFTNNPGAQSLIEYAYCVLEQNNVVASFEYVPSSLNRADFCSRSFVPLVIDDVPIALHFQKQRFFKFTGKLKSAEIQFA